MSFIPHDMYLLLMPSVGLVQLGFLFISTFQRGQPFVSADFMNIYDPDKQCLDWFVMQKL